MSGASRRRSRRRRSRRAAVTSATRGRRRAGGGSRARRASARRPSWRSSSSRTSGACSATSATSASSTSTSSNSRLGRLEAASSGRIWPSAGRLPGVELDVAERLAERGRERHVGQVPLELGAAGAAEARRRRARAPARRAAASCRARPRPRSGSARRRRRARRGPPPRASSSSAVRPSRRDRPPAGSDGAGRIGRGSSERDVLLADDRRLERAGLGAPARGRAPRRAAGGSADSGRAPRAVGRARRARASRAVRALAEAVERRGRLRVRERRREVELGERSVGRVEARAEHAALIAPAQVERPGRVGLVLEDLAAHEAERLLERGAGGAGSARWRSARAARRSGRGRARRARWRTGTPRARSRRARAPVRGRGRGGAGASRRRSAASRRRSAAARRPRQLGEAVDGTRWPRAASRISSTCFGRAPPRSRGRGGAAPSSIESDPNSRITGRLTLRGDPWLGRAPMYVGCPAGARRRVVTVDLDPTLARRDSLAR